MCLLRATPSNLITQQIAGGEVLNLLIAWHLRSLGPNSNVVSYVIIRRLYVAKQGTISRVKSRVPQKRKDKVSLRLL